MHLRRDHHPQHVVHAVIEIAEYLKPHALNAGQHRRAVQLVASDGVIQPLFQDHPGTFARGEQHAGGFGVVIQTLGAPVIHDHAEIKIVGVDHLIVTVGMIGSADPLLHALTTADDLFELRA